VYDKVIPNRRPIKKAIACEVFLVLAVGGRFVRLSARMKRLILYQDYTRKDVHDIFEPDSRFTPQSGKWGISGIVQIADREGDFVTDAELKDGDTIRFGPS
jgi:hypothetical protein